MLKDFKEDPTMTVFLLSQRTGSVGINLTVANHVFLMEPAMNPAVEVQAIGRVYRMTQTKPVTVHYMTMRYLLRRDAKSSFFLLLLLRFYSLSTQTGFL